DNMGRLVIKGAINDATITMNLASLQAGIYHLEIITDGLTYSRTILKE
ncbi:MAG: T9SS type A sorting domain-containing protein, partial [Paludibacteraceae bacterium]|nr:T9SS type A sorting domain-containing protein [Paludibacteraceae bacterium]